MAPPSARPQRAKREGPNWGSILAYAIMIALGLLALAPLLSALN